jgi:hypothetical protein
MSIDFDALSLDRVPSVVPGQANGAASAHLGTPLMLPLNSIDEDPSQPRREFDADAFQQLADTIAARGVRQPISVRIHPTQPERWIVNFGARRLRASKLAGKTDKRVAGLDLTACKALERLSQRCAERVSIRRPSAARRIWKSPKARCSRSAPSRLLMQPVVVCHAGLSHLRSKWADGPAAPLFRPIQSPG